LGDGFLAAQFFPFQGRCRAVGDSIRSTTSLAVFSGKELLWNFRQKA
jgi:hypothetical protein